MFRKEVLNPSANGVYGSINLIRPLSSWLLVTIAVALVTGLLTYLILGSYTKRATAIGYLIPAGGLVRIFAPISGVISERFAEEGKIVSKDDVLFIISDERTQLIQGGHLRIGDSHIQSLKQRRDNLLKAKDLSIASAIQNENTIKNRIEVIDEELRQRDLQINLQANRVESALKLLQRYKRLSEARAVSEVEMQERNDIYEAQQAELLNMQRQKIELRRTLRNFENELRQAPILREQGIADINKELYLLAQETYEAEARDKYAITAPMNGMISSVNAQLGQSTNGQAIANLLPEGSLLKANLYLPSRAIGFIKNGQKVKIRYQAYPYQKFGQYDGIVDEISRTPMRIDEIPTILPLAIQEGVYRVSVKLNSQNITAYGRDMPLRAGMIIEADIEQDRRRLIEWVLEPLVALDKYI